MIIKIKKKRKCRLENKEKSKAFFSFCCQHGKIMPQPEVCEKNGWRWYERKRRDVKVRQTETEHNDRARIASGVEIIWRPVIINNWSSNFIVTVGLSIVQKKSPKVECN